MGRVRVEKKMPGWVTGVTGPTAMVVVAAAVLLLGGCNQQRVEGEAPPFVELRERYNTRAERVEQMWSRCAVEIRWQDDRGRGQFEQGDGHLVLRMPNELALSIGKAGRTMYWVGSDAERYWFFDLNPPRGEPRTATVGWHDTQVATGPDEIPVPVRVDQLVHLLGVAPMPEPAAGQVPRVMREDGRDIVELAADADGRAWWRYELDRSNHLPQRIALLDQEGQVLVASELARYHSLQRQGVARGAWPMIPTRTEITTPAEDARLTIFLERDPPPSDGKARDRVRDDQFDFETLVQMLNPDEVREIIPDPELGS